MPRLKKAAPRKAFRGTQSIAASSFGMSEANTNDTQSSMGKNQLETTFGQPLPSPAYNPLMQGPHPSSPGSTVTVQSGNATIPH